MKKQLTMTETHLPNVSALTTQREAETEGVFLPISALTTHRETMTQRIFPRISADWHKKLKIIAQRRGENLSSLTRGLYRELIAREFPSPSNQKPVG